MSRLKMVRSRVSRDRALNILEMFKVTSPPVPVAEIAMELGFLIVPHDFPEDVSGMLLIREDAKAIGVNQNESPERQRFSIAHELGHYLNGHEDFSTRGTQEKIVVDGKYDWTDPQHRLEIEANEFAAELLMPSFLMRADVLSAPKFDAKDLARRYQVSEQAMWIQLIDLKLTPA